MGNLYKRLAALCEDRGISGYKMCKDIGIQPSIMTDLKMGRRSSVKAETADKMANYFGVSVGYLLGNEERSPSAVREPEITMDDFTYALYNESHDLTPENKEKLLEMAKFFKQQQNQGK